MQTNTPCEIILADGAGHTFFERQAKQLQRVPDQPDARCDLVRRQQPRPQFRDRGIAPFGNIRADRCVERRQLRHLVAVLCAHGCLTRRAAPRQRLRHITQRLPAAARLPHQPVHHRPTPRKPARAGPANKPCLAGQHPRLRLTPNRRPRESHINPRFGRRPLIPPSLKMLAAADRLG